MSKGGSDAQGSPYLPVVADWQAAVEAYIKSRRQEARAEGGSYTQHDLAAAVGTTQPIISDLLGENAPATSQLVLPISRETGIAPPAICRLILAAYRLQSQNHTRLVDLCASMLEEQAGRWDTKNDEADEHPAPDEGV